MIYYYIVFTYIDIDDNHGMSSIVIADEILSIKRTHLAIQDKFNYKSVTIINFIEITKNQFEEAK